MKYLMLLISIILINFSNNAQDSLNCKLIAKTTNTIWAYSLTMKDNYAFVGEDKFSIFNLSDIYNPILTYSNTLAAAINSIFIDGNYAYLGVNDGLIILNIANVYSPSILSYYKTSEYIEDVFVDNNVAYLGIMHYGFLIIDISNKANPSEISRVDKYIDDVWGLDKVGDNLFVASEDTGFKIFDVSNTSQAVALSTSSLPISTATVDVKVKDSVAYVANPQNLFSFNINDKTNPIIMDSLLGGGGYSIYIEDNFAYCLSTQQLRVIDISDPGNMQLVGYYPISNAGSDLYVKNKLVYAACQNSGILIIQFDNSTSVQESNEIPVGFSLAQNYPNPFNPSTIIQYSIPAYSYVQIKVYDALGQQISTLVNEYKHTGSYEIKFDAKGLSSGIYYYQLIVNNYIETKKMLLIK